MPVRMTTSAVGGAIELFRDISIESEYSQHANVLRTLRLYLHGRPGSYGAKRFLFVAAYALQLQLLCGSLVQPWRFWDMNLRPINVKLFFLMFKFGDGGNSY